MKPVFFRLRRFAVTGLLIAVAQGAVALPPGTSAEILERIQPIGSLRTADMPVAEAGEAPAEAAAPAVASAGSGETIYNTYCVACHMSGVAGAPKFGDADAWAPRIAKGKEALYESTYNGLNIMPPRGTCSACTDEDLRSTVDYMVSAAE